MGCTSINQPSNFGNIKLIKANLEASSRAAIGMTHDAHLDYYKFDSLCACVAPFGILKEMADRPIILNHTWHGFNTAQFENLGNGLIGDDATGSTRYGLITTALDQYRIPVERDLSLVGAQ